MSGLLLAVDVADLVPRLPEDRRDFYRERFCSTEDDLPVSIRKPDTAERPAPRLVSQQGQAGTLYTPPKARHSGRI